MHPVSAQELKRIIRCDLTEQTTTATLQVSSFIKYFPRFMRFAWNISLANIFDESEYHVLLIYQNSLLFSLRCARNKIRNFMIRGEEKF